MDTAKSIGGREARDKSGWSHRCTGNRWSKQLLVRTIDQRERNERVCTYADDLLAGLLDFNGTTDVYLRDLTGTLSTILVSRFRWIHYRRQTVHPIRKRISRDGSVIYRTAATDIESGVNINGSISDLVAFEVATQTGRYISVESSAPSSGNAGSSRTDQSLPTTVGMRCL